MSITNNGIGSFLPKSQFNPYASVEPRLKALNTDIHSEVSSMESSKRLHRLADVGALASMVISFTTLFSSFISKRIPVSAGQVKTLAAFLRDKENFLKLSLRINSLAGFVMGMYDIETAINTQQPTKLLGKLTMLGTGLGLFFMPMSLVLRGISFLGTGLWVAGERNDLENSLHPSFRRELDLKYLFPHSATFKKALSTVIRYSWEDIRYAISLEPWRALFSKQNPTLVSAQRYSSAFSGQFSLATFMCAIATALLKRQQRSVQQAAVENMAKAAGFLAILFQTLPLAIRAWNTRDQTDSKMMLVGIPTMILGRTFTLSSNTNWLPYSGLNGFGGALFTSALASNSQKYRLLINDLKKIYLESLANPQRTARDYLDYFKQEKNLKLLNRKLGKTRARFLINLLTHIAQKQQSTQVPLSSLLEPFVQANAPIIHTEPQNMY